MQKRNIFSEPDIWTKDWNCRIIFKNEKLECIPKIASSERIDRETGVNPVRSRHCDREPAEKLPLTGVLLGRSEWAMNWSQENCLQWISVSCGR